MRRDLATAGLAACLGLTAVAVATAAPQPDTKYSGGTSQGFFVSLKTSESGGAVSKFTITRRFDCGAENVSGTFRQSGGRMLIKENGKFFGHAEVATGGAIKSGVFTIRGDFGPNGGAARGTYRERVRLKNGARCDTGEVRFRVAAKT
jgi:hypothetical protein